MNSEIAKSRIGEVIRIDTVTSTQADFLATHVPVQNIHIRKKWDSKTDKIMSEEKVFNKYVLNTENEHQFIIVIGSSGAGKSHLIRWFAARLEQAAPENEVVLFVRRSDNSLKGTIKQLLELPEVANIPNKAMFVENIIMFIPFGVMLPILFRKFRNGWLCVLAGFICSCSIEIVQHITQIGYLQLDDVVTNTTGTLLGWLAWKVNRKI